MKRIYRATDKEEIIQTLIGDDISVFKEIWKLLLFASQVGYKNGRREKLKNIENGKGIDQSTFGNCPAWPGILYLMALTETENTEVLGNSSEIEDSRITAFQEYANGGLSILQEFFQNRIIDLDGILAFIESQESKKVNSPDLDLLI